MSLVASLFSIAARGGLKVGFILLTVSLFTGLVVAVQSTSHSYASEAQVLKEISGSPSLAVTYEPMTPNGLRVEVAAVKLNGYAVILVATKDLQRYLALHRSTVEGEYPKNGEILLGEKLKSLLQGDTLTVQGERLNVSGFISSPAHLSSATLLTPDTMETLGINTTTLYYEEAPEGCEASVAEAPSSASLVQAVTKEVLDALTLATLLLYAMLTLTCVIQGYNATHESRRVLKVFSALGTSNGRMTASLCVLALAMSGGGVALGYALGTMASAFASSLLSITLGLPYIKPIASLNLVYWLSSAFATSSIALMVGLSRGYTGVDGS